MLVVVVVVGSGRVACLLACLVILGDHFGAKQEDIKSPFRCLSAVAILAKIRLDL